MTGSGYTANKTMRKMLWLLPVLLLVCCARSKRAGLAPPSVPLVDSNSASDREREAGAEMLRVFNEYRTPPGGELRTERYLTAKAHAAAMPRATSLGTWVSLGPSAIGGRTRSLVINPTNTNIMYAGAVSGGVWKTIDGGNSWLPLTDNQLLPFICTLAMDPTNPNIIYAGTGESFGVDYQGIRGLRILKTFDGGNTWTRLTGEGQTSPPGTDGLLNNGPTLPKPLLPVSVTIGGKPAQVTYAGAAPQGVAGFMQLNVVIPSGLSPGAQSLVLAIGPNMSPAVVTVWVK